jgi:hypothetical protein
MLNTRDELEAFFKLCRKQGVTEIKFHDIEVKFGELPIKKKNIESNEEIPTDELTPEELLYLAVRDPGI